MPEAPTLDYADLAVVDDPAVAASLLDPKRARVLAALAEPGSSTSVAAAIGLTRQQVNYHLRALEAQHLLVEVGHPTAPRAHRATGARHRPGIRGLARGARQPRR